MSCSVHYLTHGVLTGSLAFASYGITLNPKIPTKQSFPGLTYNYLSREKKCSNQVPIVKKKCIYLQTRYR